MAYLEFLIKYYNSLNFKHINIDIINDLKDKLDHSINKTEVIILTLDIIRYNLELNHFHTLNETWLCKKIGQKVLNYYKIKNYLSTDDLVTVKIGSKEIEVNKIWYYINHVLPDIDKVKT